MYVRFASNITRVGDEANDVTSVQQCTGKVVKLNIQLEITYSTTAVKLHYQGTGSSDGTINFVSTGTET